MQAWDVQQFSERCEGDRLAMCGLQVMRGWSKFHRSLHQLTDLGTADGAGKKKPGP